MAMPRATSIADPVIAGRHYKTDRQAFHVLFLRRGKRFATRRIRNGRIATGSCCRPAMARCCSIPSLYLLGYEDATIDQIKNFRQLGSKTAGHPEYHFLKGIETTTGPLGQGVGNAVGMAIAEAKLAAEFGKDLVDHHTWVLAGDGCLMEGISQEAISLAGHLNLNKLTLIWDNNGITIDGKVSNADSTDQIKRFEASRLEHGFNRRPRPGGDREGAARCAQVDAAAADRGQDHHRLRRAQEGRAPRRCMARRSAPKNWPRPRPRSASPIRRSRFRRRRSMPGAPRASAPANAFGDWQGRFLAASQDKRATSSRAASRATCRAGLRDALDAYKEKLAADKPKVATRKSSQMALDVINTVLPETVGGSADLTGSNLTNTPETLPFTDTRPARPLHALRHPRARHGGDHERHRAAQGLHPLWRHVPGVHRLCAAGDPPERDHGAARHLCDDA